MTRQKSRGSPSPACAYNQGDASRGEARAGPRKGHLPWPQKTARSRLAAPATGTYGVVLAQPIRDPKEPIHSQKPAGKGRQRGLELRGTLKPARVLWCRGRNPEAQTAGGLVRARAQAWCPLPQATPLRAPPPAPLRHAAAQLPPVP